MCISGFQSHPVDIYSIMLVDGGPLMSVGNSGSFLQVTVLLSKLPLSASEV